MKLKSLTLAGAVTLAAAAPFGQGLAQTTGTAPAPTKFITQQPDSEWLARVFIGQAVHNAAGETVGDINDLVFNRKGQISTVVIGVGGFLSMGEKSVGVPFDALTFNVGKDGERVIVLALSKETLVRARSSRPPKKPPSTR